MVVAVAMEDDDDGYTYRVEGKPMKSNIFGGWETVPGFSARSKSVCEQKKASLVRSAVLNQTGMKYRVRKNRVDGGYTPAPGSDGWGLGI